MSDETLSKLLILILLEVVWLLCAIVLAVFGVSLFVLLVAGVVYGFYAFPMTRKIYNYLKRI